MPMPTNAPARSSTGRAAIAVDRLLAGAWRLPDLGHVVPDVLGVGAAGDVGDPRPDQVGPRRGEALHVAAAPVVADEVDRAVERLDLADQPREVVVAGRAPSRRASGRRSRAVTGRRRRRARGRRSAGPRWRRSRGCRGRRRSCVTSSRSWVRSGPSGAGGGPVPTLLGARGVGSPTRRPRRPGDRASSSRVPRPATGTARARRRGDDAAVASPRPPRGPHPHVLPELGCGHGRQDCRTRR